MIVRNVDNGDVALVIDALLAMKKYSPAPQTKFGDPEVARRNIQLAAEEGRAYIVDGYFVMFDVGSDWYSDEKYLIEQLILGVYPCTQPVEVAVHFLVDKAHDLQCVAVAAGDTQVSYMSDKYLAAGFQRIGSQFFKEL